LFDLPYAEHADGRCGLGLHRGVPFEALFDTLRRTSATVKLGVCISTRSARGTLLDDTGTP
jgi:hypothetical protein